MTVPAAGISLITITCRESAGFEKAANSIAKAHAKLPSDLLSFEWLVVDELFNGGDRTLELGGAVNGRFFYRHINHPPEPPYPNPTAARNAGLRAARSDYIIFLDDNMTISPGWLSHVAEAREEGWGFRSHVLYAKQFGKAVIAPAFSLDHKWKKVKPEQCSGIFGAPAGAFSEIRGFDPSYAGEMGYEDLEAVVRLHRYGVRFWTTRGSYATHFPHEPVPGKITGRNQAKFSALLENKNADHRVWTTPRAGG